MYVLFTTIIERFWSSDITDIWTLAHFEFKTHIFKLYQIFKKIKQEKLLKELY